MFEKLKSRYLTYFIALAIITVILGIALYQLTATGSQTYNSGVRQSTEVDVAITGARGSIYDANGTLLAYDKESYNVTFYRDPANSASSDRARYTQILLTTIGIIEKNGHTTIDTFMIKKEEDGSFVYDLPEGLTEAQKQSRIDNWLSNMQVTDDEMTPEELYYDLRSRFRIPEDADYETAIKLLSIWQEVQNTIYQSYNPVEIAADVSFETVSELEARGNELSGIDISMGFTRVYPQKSTAAHIVGYTGRIDEEEYQAMNSEKAKTIATPFEVLQLAVEASGGNVEAVVTELVAYVGASIQPAVKDEEGAEDDKSLYNYNVDDLVGKSGIESTMEEYLTGATKTKQGNRRLLLDPDGSIEEVLSYAAPKKGDNVILTIDLGLQEVAQEALAENIQTINAEQKQRVALNPAKYNKLLDERGSTSREISFIESGAAIVMEVKTGNVLAMVSYPSYDLNMFVGGITDEDYQALLDDPGSPLFDNAISSTSTPGSIFKMATATAGLMEGTITPHTTYTDSGPYTKYVSEEGAATAPKCWVAPNYAAHGTQNVTAALRNSCNYFFFEVADGLGIERLTHWIGELGLLSKTNVELSNENTGWIGGQKALYDPDRPLDEQKTYVPGLVYNRIIEQLKTFGEAREVEYTDEQLDKAALALMALAPMGQETMQLGPYIRQVLSDTLDIPQSVSLRYGWSNRVMDYLRELVWTDTATATQGIGATPMQMTPIAIARYMCAIGNGGKVYDAHIVDKIVDSDNNVVHDVTPTLVEDLEIPESYKTAIWQGMEQVVSAEGGGTASRGFQGYEYQNIIMGKTGTAPISNIDLEDNIWLCLLAPKDDPEIAVVIFLPNGLSSTQGYPTAKAIISQYFDAKKGIDEASPGADASGNALQ